MSVRKMNSRQFKKLCAKCYRLTNVVINVKTYIPKMRDDCDDWHANGTLKGTMGYGIRIGMGISHDKSSKAVQLQGVAANA